MQKIKRFHIKLTKDSEWAIHLGYSLTHIMAHISNYNDKPYAYFITEY